MSKRRIDTTQGQRFGECLNVWVYSDVSLLHAIDDQEGKADTFEIAILLEVLPQAVATRLSWMKRKGLLLRDTKGNWRLSAKGRAVLSDVRIMQLRELAQSYSGDSSAAWVADREWKRERRR